MGIDSDGRTVTIATGNAEQLPYGEKPTVTNRGTFNAAVFDFAFLR